MSGIYFKLMKVFPGFFKNSDNKVIKLIGAIQTAKKITTGAKSLSARRFCPILEMTSALLLALKLARL